VSADRRLCILDTKTPEVENNHSVGTEVAGNAKYFSGIFGYDRKLRFVVHPISF
jgi:hypothetical protein